MNKNPSLYSLRFYLCCVVIFLHWHFWDQAFFMRHSLLKSILLPLTDGGFALDIFFVLSGYFITYDLMLSKLEPNTSFTFKKKVAVFYIKRVLRIFPIYYFLIAILFVVNWTDLRENILYYITYNANFLVYKNAKWNNLSHTWSLAIEEQFYLIWPFIILLVPRKKLLITLIVLSSISIGCYLYAMKTNYWLSILLPSCFFTFSAGGILAILKIFYPNYTNVKSLNLLLIILLVLKTVYNTKIFNSPFLNFINDYERVIDVILALLIINFFLLKPKILNFTITSYLGKVSYGLYLYHYVITTQFVSLFSENYLLNFIIKFILLITISSISFELIEKKVIRYGGFLIKNRVINIVLKRNIEISEQSNLHNK